MNDHRSVHPALLRFPPERLRAYVRAIWEHAGSTPREAERVADHLVASNLAGHDSHGVGMIPRYAASARANQLQLNRHAQVVRDVGAVLTIDGRLGFGQVIAYEAMELGIERAKKLGVCAVGLRNAHHIGRIGHWAEQCARAGFVSFHFVNVAGDPLVAPFGGTDRRIGTNPFCAAFPRDGAPPLLLDFATSAVAYGKTRVAYNQRKPVPEGALIDHAGKPTVDPAVMQMPPFGSLLPAGGAASGHKGYGLAVICELFGGALNGGYTTHADTLQKTPAIVNGMLSVIVDPRAFDAMGAQQEADAFVEWVKASPVADGVAQVQMPGEPERRNRVERETNGVPVDAETWRQIRDAACELGMSADEAARWAEGTG
ncbi:malate/lactate/ureidoglycolate dehydrogenase [Paraburkholderia caballeronis]|uniref:malate/lactate/ureidoglycolate dehydrogenase n=1 Tax=Paraburkholderia caballeronis TaxID=416943 RepID=UPI001065C7F9|nr:malate/lactate/ureidoglycolate dehydrogenase [Paraburkholderia caballeronis]TDV13876.1 putative oxidoreductase [Paraburkholderia caballeronis]TDV15390.1 putative oxidoreductase [Paraburkholderia caballeronis]TDV24857.1 putative oxidoreductase [Paraburkholderia caballeronis]